MQNLDMEALQKNVAESAVFTFKKQIDNIQKVVGSKLPFIYMISTLCAVVLDFFAFFIILALFGIKAEGDAAPLVLLLLNLLFFFTAYLWVKYLIKARLTLPPKIRKQVDDMVKAQADQMQLGLDNLV